MTCYPLSDDIFFKIFFLKIKNEVTEMCLPFSSDHLGLNANRKANEQCRKSGFQWTFPEHLMDIQKCFSSNKGGFSSCVCLMFMTVSIYNTLFAIAQYMYWGGWMQLSSSIVDFHFLNNGPIAMELQIWTIRQKVVVEFLMLKWQDHLSI